MFECIKKWFNGPDINDCNIEVKIKYVEKKNQTGRYYSLARYSVAAYWRIEGAWVWRSAGIFHRSDYGNCITDIKPNEVQKYLDLARNRVKACLSKTSSDDMRCKFHVSELGDSSDMLYNRKSSRSNLSTGGSGVKYSPLVTGRSRP